MSRPGGLGSRLTAWEKLDASSSDPFDVLVVGGGITGAGIALDATSRGLRVALVERFDFASGTSSKSSKLVHGGLRYLEQRDFGLVREASVERGLLNRLAPHLVESIPFVIPVADRWRRARFGVGMWVYDALASFRNTSPHRYIDPDAVTALIPALKTPGTASGGLRGGYVYYDSKTDDVRLVIEVLMQAVRLGATVCNYAALRDLDCSDNGCRALVEDTIEGSLIEVAARRVVVAGGVWNDRIEALTNRRAAPRLRPSKGIHLVFRNEDVPLAEAAGFIPDARQKRMLFLIPWHDVVVVGTTDTEYAGDLDHPQVTPDERSYFLDALNAALGLSLSDRDVVSAWAGLRPLVRAEGSTVDLSRSHAVYEFAPGVVGITGGKLTTYRRMAQDAVDRIAPDFDHAGRSRTRWIRLGCSDVAALTSAVERRAERLGVSAESARHLVRCYGDRALAVLEVGAESGSTDPLVEGRPPIGAEALYCARSEMAVQLSDLLARRTRLALTSGGAGLEDEPVRMLGGELAWNSTESERQRLSYRVEVELERGKSLPRGVHA
ncbi:MAG: glycerol-3-phosphate dehydrogenase/oxidase [Actinomycetota bacterium]